MLKILKEIIQSWPPAARLLAWSKSITFPGFEGMPLFDVARFFVNGLLKGSLNEKAAAVSFNLFLAVFPSIIVIFTLISYIPIGGFHEALLDAMRNVLPEQTLDLAYSTIEDIVKRQRGGLLSFGFIFAAYFATAGIGSLISAFNNTIQAIETRNWLTQQLVGIVLLFVLAGLLVVGVTLMIVTKLFLDYLIAHNLITGFLVPLALSISKWLVIVALYYFSISIIFFLAPARRSRFRFFSAGSSLATVLTIAASIGFNIYINSFSRFNILYGSIGTLMFIMLWIYYNSLVLLIGFELNASIYSAKSKFSA